MLGMAQSLICIKSENRHYYEEIYQNSLQLGSSINLNNLKPTFTFKKCRILRHVIFYLCLVMRKENWKWAAEMHGIWWTEIEMSTCLYGSPLFESVRNVWLRCPVKGVFYEMGHVTQFAPYYLLNKRIIFTIHDTDCVHVHDVVRQIMPNAFFMAKVHHPWPIWKYLFALVMTSSDTYHNK